MFSLEKLIDQEKDDDFFDVVDVLERYFRNPLIPNVVKKNNLKYSFTKILTYIDKSNISNLFNLFYEYKFISHFLLEFKEDIAKLIIDIDYPFSITEYYSIIEDSLETAMSKAKFLKPFLKNHFHYIKKTFLDKNRFYLSDETIECIKNYLNNYYTNNSHDVIKNLIENSLYALDFYTIGTIKEIISDIDIYFVDKVIKELLEENNMVYTDIKFCGEGAFSSVYIIKDKVIKIGRQRYTYEIPNSKHIIQPFFRYQFLYQEKPYLTVELTQLVDTKNIDKKSLFKLFCDLRNEGLFWNDPKIDNVGILKKDNFLTYNNECIFIDQKANGFTSNIEEYNQRGSFVIIDTDHIYNEDEMPEILNCYASELESKYQQKKVRVKTKSKQPKDIL